MMSHTPRSPESPGFPHTDDLNRNHRFFPSCRDHDKPIVDQLIRPSGMHVPLIPPVKFPSCKFYPLMFKRTMTRFRLRRVNEGSLKAPRRLLEIGVEGSWRMFSARGRPTVMDWNIRRLVPFNRKNWHLLGLFARNIGLSPGQLASLLVEQGLNELANEKPRLGLPSR